MSENESQSFEQILILKTTSSARSWREVMTYHEISEDLRGITSVLDVGAGGSDFTAYLLEESKDAYALDPNYQKEDLIKEKVNEHLKFMSSKTSENSYWIRYIANQIEALKRFELSRKSFPDRYIAASASHIPFPQDRFDLVTSTNSITLYMDRDKDLFFTAVAECIRVTKPGGMVKLFPFRDIYAPRNIPPEENERLYRKRRENQEDLLSELDQNPEIEFELIDSTQTHNGKLFITKLRI